MLCSEVTNERVFETIDAIMGSSRNLQMQTAYEREKKRAGRSKIAEQCRQMAEFVICLNKNLVV
jgi:hypothetical protein